MTEPDDPEKDGDAWGAVMCVNKRCVTYGWPNGNHGVRVLDGVDVADSRGSDAYKQAAIRRWNKRAQ